MKFKIVILIGIVLSSSLTPCAYAQTIDKDVPAQYTLHPCVNKIEMDCIESFTFSYPSGLRGSVKLINSPSGSTTDKFGQLVENSSATWSFVDNQRSQRHFTTVATLSTEKYNSPAYNKLYPSLWFYIFDLLKSDIDAGLTFQISFRTSWLKPVNAAAYAMNGDLVQKPISGGNVFTFTGSPFLSTSFNDTSKFAQLSDPTIMLTSDSEHPTLYFLIDHASSIAGGSMYDASCADAGYTFESDNGIAAGQPSLEGTNSLNFVMSAPHFYSDGTINKGFFSANIHKAYLDCKFPQNTLTKFPQISVSVTDQNGVAEVATVSSEIKNGIYRIRAAGFHFSSPRIIVSGVEKQTVEASAVKPKPSSEKINLKKSITCINIRTKKKYVTTSLKCLSGFKKVG